MHNLAELLDDVRARFAHVDRCPFAGERVFFENAGGALTLNTVVETTARYAAIPDNQGRTNVASEALVAMISKARADMRVFLNAKGGQIILGESGTEMLFRMIRTAVMGTGVGRVLGSTLEHPASRSAAAHWAEKAGKTHVLVPHVDETGTVGVDQYLSEITPDTVVATILHTSPVTGMGVDVAAISEAIRAVAPDCFIIVDGIQHAAHGLIDIDGYGIDGYAISPYKMFSRHGYGVAWISDRLARLSHESLIGGPAENWELGTRDTGAYATLSDVVNYFEWLGGKVSTATDRRSRIEAAGRAIHEHEHALTHAILFGTGNFKGVSELPGLTVVGGVENPAREGLVSLWSETVSSAEIVDRLNDAGIRTHIRKADHYSGNILEPLGRSDCVRISLCHYNSEAEVAKLLSVLADITGASS